MTTVRAPLLCSTLVVLLATACSSPESEDHHTHDADTDTGQANHHDDDAAHHHEEDAAHSHDGGHGSDADSVDLGPDVTITPEAEAYCECMLLNCHDSFHDEWGGSDPEALASCGADASRLEESVLECRKTNCDAVGSDRATCPEAFGEAC